MIDRMWKHTTGQPFIAATAFAALVHSTWSLGTLFAGPAPTLSFALVRIDPGAFALQAVALTYWLLPALAIAFALDVGQVATAHDISSGRRNWRKYVTFATFSVATYYLQFIYIAHHMPALDLGAGVAYPGVVHAVRNAGLWIIPALLPASTLLYTLSHDAQPDAVRVQVERTPAHALVEPPTQEDDTAEVRAVDAYALEDTQPKPMRVRTGSSSGTHTNELENAVHMRADGQYVGTCPHCAQEYVKDTHTSAVNALASHVGRWCKARPAQAQS
jgi:hypothetical protein